MDGSAGDADGERVTRRNKTNFVYNVVPKLCHFAFALIESFLNP
jgi:hypothetical protein